MSIDTSQNQSAASDDPLKGGFRDCLGSTAAAIVLYTANRPLLPPDMDSGGVMSVPELITLNGNHWRKILSIFAKLTSLDDDWKTYRDHRLLQEREVISFADSLQESAAFHLIAGKASWEYLGVNLQEFQALDVEQRLWVNGNVMCTPYFDYRQFPNALIDVARARIFEKLSV